MSPGYRRLKERLSISCKKLNLKPPYKVTIEQETYLDLDNIVKCVIDSLGNCIENDRYIHELVVTKKPLKRGSESKLIVYVEEITPSLNS